MCASAVSDSQLIWRHRWWFHCYLEVVVVVVGWWLVVMVFVVVDSVNLGVGFVPHIPMIR